MKKEEIYISSQEENNKGSSFEKYIFNVASVGPGSARKYADVVRRFERGGYNFTIADINRFLKKDPRTVVKAALVHYAKSLGMHELANEIKNLGYTKKPKNIRTIPTYEEFVRVIESLDKENMMIAELMMYTGARCSEALKVEFRDIEPNRRIRLKGKGGKERWNQLPSAFYMRLMDYLRNEKGISGNMPIFYSDSTAGIENKAKMFWFKLHRAGLRTIQKNIQTHDFRRYRATKFYEDTHDIQAVKEMLGHSSIETTSIYTRFVDRDKILKRWEELSDELQMPRNKKGTKQASE